MYQELLSRLVNAIESGQSHEIVEITQSMQEFEISLFPLDDDKEIVMSHDGFYYTAREWQVVIWKFQQWAQFGRIFSNRTNSFQAVKELYIEREDDDPESFIIGISATTEDGYSVFIPDGWRWKMPDDAFREYQKEWL